MNTPEKIPQFYGHPTAIERAYLYKEGAITLMLRKGKRYYIEIQHFNNEHINLVIIEPDGTLTQKTMFGKDEEN